MAIAFVASTKVEPLGPNGGTSPDIDTASADLIVMADAEGAGLTNSPTVISDSESNAYTKLVGVLYPVLASDLKLAYSSGPATSATHTFTLSGTNCTSSACIAAFSGAAGSLYEASSAGDHQDAATSIQGGSITPASDDSLVIAILLTANANVTASIDGGFTIAEQLPWVSNIRFGCAIAYLIQTSAAAANPTWTISGGTPDWISARNYVFGPGGAAPTLTADTGMFTETGEAATWGRGFVGAIGHYTLTGLPADFISRAPYVSADTGYYALTGYPATFRTNDDYLLDAMPGQFVVTGNPATLCKAKAWPKVDCSDSPWVNVRAASSN